jgi:hypothetical protein
MRIPYPQIGPHMDYIQEYVLLVEKTTGIKVGALQLLSKRCEYHRINNAFLNYNFVK